MALALRLVGVGLVTAVLLSALGQFQQRGLQMAVRMAAIIIVLLSLVVPLADVLAALDRLTAVARIRGLYLGVLLKVLGIAYLTTIGASLAADIGEGALAAKVELAGKLLILVLAVPVLTGIMALLLKILPR
ncbi:MAG: SpoIIIAC/SpoIIIAD family protein [Clostridia bacterium]